jgi:hypothetical protein
MKKLSYLFLSIIFLSVTYLTSCSKSSSSSVTGPSIHFITDAGYISTNTTVQVNTLLLFGINATNGDVKLKRFLVQRIFKNKTITQVDTAIQVASFSYTLHTAAQATEGTETVTFTVIDNNGSSAAVMVMITTTPAPASGPINTYSAKVLGAQTSTSGNSFATSNGNVYFLPEAKINAALVDWVYYSDPANLSTLSAPSDSAAAAIYNDATNGIATWPVRNATLFKKVTDPINWAGITNDSIIVLENQSGVTFSKLGNIVINDFLAFKTASGKKGMIQVKALTPDVTGTITLNVKVQQ